VGQVLERFSDAVISVLTPAEKERIAQFRNRLEEYDQHLSALYAEFVKQVEQEYKQLYFEIRETFDEEKTSLYRVEHSIKLAEVSGVPEERIIRDNTQLDELFLKEERL
jgi:uncharacterized membrane-anchored protein YhcB (DUF1043 family)